MAAYGAALEERTCERVPLAWATTQNNLTLALATRPPTVLNALRAELERAQKPWWRRWLGR